MSYLKARDIVSGAEGKAYATIDGVVYDLFNIVNFEATVEKIKKDFKTLGMRTKQYKASGADMKGKIEYYTGTTSTIFTRLMRDYVKTGKDVFFTLTITNDDPTTTIGPRTTVFYNVNIDTVKLMALDVDSDGLTEDLEFTFDDFETLEEFHEAAE